MKSTITKKTSSKYMKNTKKLSKNRLLFGGISGAVATLTTYPLDYIKTRFQVNRNVNYRHLYKGITPALISVVPSKAISLYVYNKYSGITHRSQISASVLAIMSTLLVCTPIYFTKTRMQLPNYIGIRHIINHEGPRVFWSGLTISLLAIPKFILYILPYEYIKHDTTFDPKRIIVASSICKIFSSTIMYPHEVIRTHLRIPYQKKSISTIVNELKYRKLFSGLTPHLIRVIPHNTLVWLTYETLINISK